MYTTELKSSPGTPAHISRNDLRQKFVDITVPLADHLKLTVPNPGLAWNVERDEHGEGDHCPRPCSADGSWHRPSPPRLGGARSLRGIDLVERPHCASTESIEVSRLGSTPCKSLWRCTSCLEPFDRFKRH